VKLDWDLFRNILLFVEDNSSPNRWLNLEDFLQICPNKDKVLEHLLLLKKDAFIEGEASYADNECAEFIVTGLTMKSHDYLNTIRNDTIWNQIKDYLSNHAISISFTAIELALKSIS